MLSISRALKKNAETSEIAAANDNADLPIHKYRKNILETIENNKITMINSPTGSGKVWQSLSF